MAPGVLTPAPAGRTPVRRSQHEPQSPTCTAQRHGTEAAYSYYDCRCPTAREAWRLYRKRRREGRADPRMVDPTGTRRRLQALAAIGWSPHLLARELGFTATNAVRHLMRTGRGKINTRTAEAVRHLYDRLSMTPGPSTRARNHARRAGWAPPLAWDDHDLDNPTPNPPTHPPAAAGPGTTTPWSN